jgi:hypothetical protein
VNRSFLVREWGAVTFVLTVLVGIIIVPIALVVGNKPPPPPALPNPTPTVSAAASTARVNPPVVIPNG